MSGLFEVLAASPDEERVAQEQSAQRFEAAVYDVRSELGEFLFSAANVPEFRTRVALVKDDAMRIVDRSLMPVTGVMRKIVGRNSVLEKEFRSRHAMRKGAPFADYKDFDDCTSKNADKGDPSAYCGEIKHKVEGSRYAMESDQLDMSGDSGMPETSGIDPGGSSLGSAEAGPPMENLTKGMTAWRHQADESDGFGYDLPGAISKGQGPNQMLGPIGPAMGVGASDPTPAFNPGPSAPKDQMTPTARRRQADGTGPALIPQGDFGAYQNSVDEGGPEKVDSHVFIPGEHDKEYTDQVTAKVQKLFMQYVGFCRRNRLALNLATLERHGQKLAPRDYLVIAMGLNKIASGYTDHMFGPGMDNPDAALLQHYQDNPQSQFHKDVPVQGPRHPDERAANRRTAAPDYLLKAKDALEGLLNQKAEEFQTGIQPLQQAFQTIQQAQAVEQANNPLNVTPPAGTINVLPDAPGGMPGGDPAAAGGAPGDPSAPPPAAAAAGLDGGGGLPPDPTQQMAASRVRMPWESGDYPKGRRPA